MGKLDEFDFVGDDEKKSSKQTPKRKSTSSLLDQLDARPKTPAKTPPKPSTPLKNTTPASSKLSTIPPDRFNISLDSIAKSASAVRSKSNNFSSSQSSQPTLSPPVQTKARRNGSNASILSPSKVKPNKDDDEDDADDQFNFVSEVNQTPKQSTIEKSSRAPRRNTPGQEKEPEPIIDVEDEELIEIPPPSSRSRRGSRLGASAPVVVPAVTTPTTPRRSSRRAASLANDVPVVDLDVRVQTRRQKPTQKSPEKAPKRASNRREKPVEKRKQERKQKEEVKAVSEQTRVTRARKEKKEEEVVVAVSSDSDEEMEDAVDEEEQGEDQEEEVESLEEAEGSEEEAEGLEEEQEDEQTLGEAEGLEEEEEEEEFDDDVTEFAHVTGTLPSIDSPMHEAIIERFEYRQEEFAVGDCIEVVSSDEEEKKGWMARILSFCVPSLEKVRESYNRDVYISPCFPLTELRFNNVEMHPEEVWMTLQWFEGPEDLNSQDIYSTNPVFENERLESDSVDQNDLTCLKWKCRVVQVVDQKMTEQHAFGRICELGAKAEFSVPTYFSRYWQSTKSGNRTFLYAPKNKPRLIEYVYDETYELDMEDKAKLLEVMETVKKEEGEGRKRQIDRIRRVVPVKQETPAAAIAPVAKRPRVEGERVVSKGKGAKKAATKEDEEMEEKSEEEYEDRSDDSDSSDESDDETESEDEADDSEEEADGSKGRGGKAGARRSSGAASSSSSRARMPRREKKENVEDLIRRKLKKRAKRALNSRSGPLTRDEEILLSGNVVAWAQSKLEISSVPKSLPCREKEMKDMLGHVRDALLSTRGIFLYVSGMPGTGKTATINEILRLLREMQEEGDLPDFQQVEVNCVKFNRPADAYVAIYKGLESARISRAKYKNISHAKQNEMLLADLLKERDEAGLARVIVVDELDFICQRDTRVLYNLMDWPTQPESRMIVIAAANTFDLPDQLMPRAESRFSLKRMPFLPYSFEQIKRILQSRLDEVRAIFEDKALELIARKVAAQSSDLRRCLEICRLSLTVCERRALNDLKLQPPTRLEDLGTFPRVSMNDVLTAIREIADQPHIGFIQCLEVYNKLLLLAMSLQVLETSSIRQNCRKVFERTKVLCRFLEIPVVTSADLIPMLANLVDLGLLSTLNALQSNKDPYYSIDLACEIRFEINPEDVSFALREDDEVGSLVEKFWT